MAAEAQAAQKRQQSSVSPSLSSLQLPLKRKRNLPGTPDPNAEVVALSPKTLLATNRFICEICQKGFQRDQNLQLHRRGHNLPWKLRQRSGDEEVRKRVYVCPEPTCVHHEPGRALGDLTGIKKHFCRKHGEKKWKCERCNKRYAVQSDWKAHSKTCGSREYRCACGTLFSRRDSFITHKAFCDSLVTEGPKTTSSAYLPSSRFAFLPKPAQQNHPQQQIPATPPFLSAQYHHSPNHLPYSTAFNHQENVPVSTTMMQQFNSMGGFSADPLNFLLQPNNTNTTPNYSTALNHQENVPVSTMTMQQFNSMGGFSADPLNFLMQPNNTTNTNTTPNYSTNPVSLPFYHSERPQVGPTDVLQNALQMGPPSTSNPSTVLSSPIYFASSSSSSSSQNPNPNTSRNESKESTISGGFLQTGNSDEEFNFQRNLEILDFWEANEQPPRDFLELSADDLLQISSKLGPPNSQDSSPENSQQFPPFMGV